jgi:hypothetical protein
VGRLVQHRTPPTRTSTTSHPRPSRNLPTLTSKPCRGQRNSTREVSGLARAAQLVEDDGLRGASGMPDRDQC